jgi:hypothetical protein
MRARLWRAPELPELHQILGSAAKKQAQAEDSTTANGN